MIGIITLNPSVDRRYVVNDLKSGVHRCGEYSFTAGGKGINVARVANQLKEDVMCLGFLGGFSGKFIQSKLDELGINNDFTWVEGETRTCLSLITEEKEQIEVLEKGPVIRKEEIADFKEKYIKLLDNVELVVASGSLPLGLDEDFYKEMIELANDNGIKFILDTSGMTLIRAIESEPFLIKPNKEELECITKRNIKTIEDIKFACSELMEIGAKNVAVSLGGEGMFFGSQDGTYKVSVPKIKVVNPVGAGDSTVAGFASGFTKKYKIEQVLKLANACGVSNTMEKETGHIIVDAINGLMDDINVKKLL